MTDSTELHFRSATALAGDIRARRISSRDALDAFLERIARHDRDLHLVVTLDVEGARREAELADRDLARGEWRGPLHGVPMTIKDSFQTKGLRTTSGAPELAEHVPAGDAVPVARLRAAGAVVFGKTNLPTYAGDVQSYNPVFGQSNNPWDRTRSPGGSSGGSAGALAAGFTPLELGSDIGGSIRNPSHCCGVVGHKPSYRLVPAQGQIPGPPGTLTQADIAVAGPMARTVEDLELGLEVLAGPDDWESVGWKLALRPPRHSRLEDFRIAVWIDDDFCPLSSEVGRLLNAAVDTIERAGATLGRDARPTFTFEYASRVYDQLLGAAQCGGFSFDEIEEMARRVLSGSHDPGMEHSILRHRAWLSANERRLQMRKKWLEFFKEWDAVLMPVSPVPAIPHDHSEPMARRTIDVDGRRRPYGDQIKWMGLTGVAYLPATVVPVSRGPTSRTAPRWRSRATSNGCSAGSKRPGCPSRRPNGGARSRDRSGGCDRDRSGVGAASAPPQRSAGGR
jgi:amidase